MVQTDVLVKLLYADEMRENAKTVAKCKGLWIEFHTHVTTMTSQPAQNTDI